MTRKGSDEPGRLLTTDQAHSFWDRRHLTESDLRSGGDIGLSDQENVIFYQIRLGLLFQALAGSVPLPRHATVLDAGCGKGWFSRKLAEAGLRVHGFDASPTAIEFARQANSGPEYAVATLAAFRPLRHFDAVVGVDVLFHVTDDTEWSASVRNLAGAVRTGGALVVSDTVASSRRILGTYIVHRPKEEYFDLLSRAGFEYREGLPYRFRSNPLGMHVYQRVW